MPATVQPVRIVAPPTPPPVMEYRYLGKMITPAGEQLVYLAKGERVVLASIGHQLEDGFVVQAINADEIVLLYPRLGMLSPIPVPHGE